LDSETLLAMNRLKQKWRQRTNYIAVILRMIATSRIKWNIDSISVITVTICMLLKSAHDSNVSSNLQRPCSYHIRKSRVTDILGILVWRLHHCHTTPLHTNRVRYFSCNQYIQVRLYFTIQADSTGNQRVHTKITHTTKDCSKEMIVRKEKLTLG